MKAPSADTNSPNTITPVIVGQGAIGSLLAYYFEQASIEYRVLTRNGAPLPLDVDTGNTEHSLDAQRFVPEGITPAQLGAENAIFLPLKAFQIQPCVEALAPYLNGATLVLMHNGMGTSDGLRQRLPNTPLAACLTSNGVFKPRDGQIRLTGTGPTQLGWIHTPRREVTQWFKSVCLPALPLGSWTQHIESCQWQKLAVNAIINPITARDKVNNGALLAAHYTEEISALCEEIASIQQACGIEAHSHQLMDTVRRVAENTAQNFSSMNRDCFYQRPTEIDYINGYLLQQAQKHRLTAPLNQALYEAIKALTGDTPAR